MENCDCLSTYENWMLFCMERADPPIRLHGRLLACLHVHVSVYLCAADPSTSLLMCLQVLLTVFYYIVFPCQSAYVSAGSSVSLPVTCLHINLSVCLSFSRFICQSPYVSADSSVSLLSSAWHELTACRASWLPGLPEKLNYDLDICLCEDREAGTRLTPETGRKGAARDHRRKNTGRM